MQSYTANRDSLSEDQIWIVQHPPIYTLGRSASRDDIIRANNIPLINIDRGGQITYHGPGQLVFYCLLDLRRAKLGVKKFVYRIEQTLIDWLGTYEIDAFRKANAPGVYTNAGKIAALGIRVKNGLCYHGVSLNVDMNLEPFNDINPCGYVGMKVCQLADYEVNIDLSYCAQSFANSLQEILNKDYYVV